MLPALAHGFADPQARMGGGGEGHQVGRTHVDVEVVRAGGDAPAPVVGVEVRLEALGQAAAVWPELTARTDAAGRAHFDGVPVVGGVTLTARTTADEVAWESGPLKLSNGKASSTRIEVLARSADASGVEVALLSTELYLWEGQVGYEQTWRLVNRGGTAYDPKLAGGAAITLPLPRGSGRARLRNQPAEHAVVSDQGGAWKGLVRPESAGGTTIGVGGFISYDGPSLRFEQLADLPVRESRVHVPEVPEVRGRRLEGVRLSVKGAEAFERREIASGDTAWVGSGRTGGDPKALGFEVSGLPHRAAWPPWLALFLAHLPLLWGTRRLRRAKR